MLHHIHSSLFTLIRLQDNALKTCNSFSAEVILQMENYEWPGNVRDLENVMQRTALLTKGPVVTEFYHKPEVTRPNLSDTEVKSIVENERDYIIATLRSCNWKVYGPGGAAELLDMNVSTLNSRIKNRY